MFSRIAFLCLFITLAAGGCARQEQPVPEAPAPAQEAPAAQPAPAPEQPGQTQPLKLSSPNSEEAQEALKRVYENAVSMDASRNARFVVGDFNGDFSQDIAIVVKPARDKLAAINDEVANWILGDALKDLDFDSRVKLQKSASTPARIRIQEDDLLLAIIHGFGPVGWRNPEAQQTYLLRNAVGTDLRAQPLKALMAAWKDEKKPPLRGDVIQQTLVGEAGFIYYTGSNYGWYDRRRYRQEQERRSPH